MIGFSDDQANNFLDKVAKDGIFTSKKWSDHWMDKGLSIPKFTLKKFK